MEFLIDSDEDESSSNSSSSKNKSDIILETSHRVVPVMSKWTELSDDEDGSDSYAVETDGLDCNCTTGILPKADDLFSSVVAQFSVNGNQNERLIKPKEYCAPIVGTVEGMVAVVKHANDSHVTKKNPASSSGSTVVLQGGKIRTAPIKGSTVIGATPKPTVMSDSKEKDKDSAKDRVKRQRLNGQSGIGTDFKTWKSEEEMRQRQQYD